MEIKNIELEKIIDPAFQPRERIELAGLEALAASIKELGLINPITVRENETGYELVAGSRRWHACKMLGWETIPARVIRKESRESALLQFSENFHRQDLNPLETADMLKFMLEELGYSSIELAQLCNRDRGWVSRMLSLLDLPDYLRDSVRSGQMSFSVALELNRIQDEKLKERYTAYALDGGCTEKMARSWVKQASMTVAAKEQRDRLRGQGEEVPQELETLEYEERKCVVCSAPEGKVLLEDVLLCWHCRQAILKS